MPMSSPMMTTMLGFLSWANAVCVTEGPITPTIKSTIAKYLLFRTDIRVSLLVLAPASSSISSRSGLLDAERYQALINQFSPVVHRVFSIAPLEDGYVRDRCATYALINGGS